MMMKALAKIAPPTKLSISEWADNHRVLSPEASAEPGPWSTSRAEFQRGIMDCISETDCSLVALMCSAQVGKTEMINNVLAFHMHSDPAPVLILQPTLDIANMWSTDRLAPMLRDTPILKGLVEDPRYRRSGNTMLHKKFPGGHLTVVGANSPAGLAARPIRIVLADEVDRYPASAGSEGDPFNLAVKRTTTFWNRRVIAVSTPTIKNFSRIESIYATSDQRVYMVPCVHCGHTQRLMWAMVRWPEAEPAKAALHCEECGAEWSEADRLRAVSKGEWVATNSAGRYPGFHISELYSPWSSIPKIAQDFVDAQSSPEKRRVWVNTVLGEVYESDADSIDHHLLQGEGRQEDWSEGAPNRILLVTCGVDVQNDGLHIERVGWGFEEESWALDYHVIPGDPTDTEVWRRLDAYIAEPTLRQDGKRLPVRATCVDSGGHHTQRVYAWCRARRNRQVYAIKGRDEMLTVWPQQLKRRKDQQQKVTVIGVTVAKDAVYARLKVPTPGPGFCHFPKGRSPIWFEQLTSEVVETQYLRGFPKRVFILPPGKRNEALDCRVYAYAALASLNVRWGTELNAAHAAPAVPPTLAPQVAQAVVAAQAMAEPQRTVAPRAAAAPRPRAGGWLHGGSSRSSWLSRR